MVRRCLHVLTLTMVLFLAACGGAPATTEAPSAAPAAAATTAPTTEAMAPTTGATTEATTAATTAAGPTMAATTMATAGVAAPTAAATGGEPFKVAIVMPSGTTDLAWSQSMYDALKAIQTKMGGESAMTIQYSENMFNVTDAAAALRDYASSGNNLIIAHGTQYGTSMFEVAKDFPDVSFAWGTASDIGDKEGLKNVFAYNAQAQEGGYINGVMAALLTKSGKIGVVGPVEAGDAKTYIDGFEQGVHSIKADATVAKIYTGSFGDTAKAAEAANTHIAAGADVLTGSAQQVVGAIGVAKDKNIPWLGTQSDQSSLAPNLVVASQVYDWTGMLEDMITKIKAGTLGGTAYDLTLENGGLKISINQGYQLPPEVKAAVDTATAALNSGTVTIPAVRRKRISIDDTDHIFSICVIYG